MTRNEKTVGMGSGNASEQMVAVQIQVSAADYADMMNHIDEGRGGRPLVAVNKVLQRNEGHEKFESNWRNLGSGNFVNIGGKLHRVIDPEASGVFLHSGEQLPKNCSVKQQPIAMQRNKGTRCAMVCMECDKNFTKRITEHTFEVKCPKCGGYDTEPTGL